MVLANALDWFTNHGHYKTLIHCMDSDMFWIVTTVVLDVAVATGYALIAMHWWKNERHLPPIPAKRALANMRNIFAFCGICGYLFIPVKMFWPAWRLYDMFMVVLVYFTWKYAWGARDLKVIYAEMGRSGQLARDLEKTREESKRKTFFLNAISHDLRTPLNGLLLQAGLAEIGMQSNDQQTIREAVAEIKNAAQATAELLNNFLEYARVDWAGDNNTHSNVDLASLVGEVVRLSHPAAEQKGLTLQNNALDAPLIRSDRVKIERILLNLINNAVKFTDTGGIRIESERTADTIELHVIDTGVGIPADVQAHLFDEFYQVHNGERNPRKGFGLGLTIARRLARQLGGDVTVDSAPGSGSRFSVAIPAVSPAVENSPLVGATSAMAAV